MAAHSALWIQRAFRTEPANAAILEEAIKGIYRAAKLAEPRVILVPSPLVMVMAGGIASVWWYLFKNKLLGERRRGVRLNDATLDEILDGDYDVILETCLNTKTDHATRAATDYATRAATNRATHAAISDAFHDVTFSATDAIRAATEAATRNANRSWRALAVSFVGEEWAEAAVLAARRLAYRYMDEGDDDYWFGWCCYLTAARDILGLKLEPHEVYAYWEQAAINGGSRWMHPKFCMVSDFPEILRVNARYQLHAEFGPSHRWRDGFSIWHLNGVRVERWMAELRPDDIDARKVLQIENVDQRREVIRRMGSERLVAQLDATVLDTETREVGGKYELLAIDMNHGEPWRFLKMVNASTGAVHIEAVPRECETVRHAINWRASQDIDKDWFPTILT
jgi:hypothetical protein